MTIPSYSRPARTRGRMNPMRRIALTGGVLYLLTFAASIPQLKLFKNVVDNRDYITSSGSNTSLLCGALLEIITAAAGIGTAIALYPVLKRYSQTAAIGLVTSRVVEATLIIVGVMCLLSVVTLQHDFAGATGPRADALTVTGHALVSMRQWTFLLGPGFMAGVNDLLLGYLLYRSGLVPRVISIIGLIGGPIILVSDISTLFGGWGQTSAAGFWFGLPVGVFEFSLGVWLTFKGFKTAALTSVTASSSVAPTGVEQVVPVG